MALLPLIGVRVIDRNGEPASAGTLSVFLNRTTTLASVFSDPELTTAVSNPIELDGGGDLPSAVFVEGGERYTLRWQYSDEAEIRTVNDVFGWSELSQSVAATVAAASASAYADGDSTYIKGFGRYFFGASSALAADGVTVINVDSGGQLIRDPAPITASMFGATLDGVADDSAAHNSAISAGVSPYIIDGPTHLDSAVTFPNTMLVIARGAFSGSTLTAKKLIHESEGWESGVSGVLDIRAFGGYPDQGDTVDITTAFNAALTEANNVANNEEISFPRGTFDFLTKPNDINFKCHISGAGQNVTTLNKRFVSASVDEGIINIKTGATGVRVRDFIARAQSASRSGSAGTGCLVSVLADAAGSPSWVSLERLYLTTAGGSGNSYMERSLVVDGSLNETGSPGVRDLQMTDVSCFGGEEGSALFKSAINLGIQGGGGFFSAGGDSGEVEITGTATVDSDSVIINTPYIASLQLDYLTRALINSANFAGTITNTSNVTKCVINGNVDGAAEDNWLDSRYNSPGEDLTATDADATPSVANAATLTTANTGATTITGLDDMTKGQEVLLIAGDANTTIDFSGTSLKGNGGSDLTLANGDAVLFRKGSGGNIYALHVDV